MFNKSAHISDGTARKILAIAKHTFYERIYDIKVLNNDTKDLKPPYLILSNHVNVWDPALINLYVNYPIRFVTSDVWFTKPLQKKLLNYVGAIPKTKNVSDYFTIKKIIQACKKSNVIGIFPEGIRSWDGVTNKLFFSTAKLVKHLKIPVVCVLLKGACLALPRWANKSRKGYVEISYKLTLTPKTIDTFSIEEIYKILTQNLQHNEYEWQQEKLYKYKGLHLAENIERFLFACPHCNTIGKLQSLSSTLKCKSCGYRIKYNEYGFLKAINNPTYYRTPRDWNIWQHELLKKIIKNTPSQISILEDSNTIYYKGTQSEGTTKVGEGILKIDNNSLMFINNRGEQQTFLNNNIKGLNVKWNDHVDFYYNKQLHRFGFYNNVSAYKWVELINYINEANRKNLLIK